MSQPRSRSSRLLLAIGLISSAAALTASYLYLTAPLDESQLSLNRPRRKVIVSSNSADELLRIIPKNAVDTDEIYVTLLHSSQPRHPAKVDDEQEADDGESDEDEEKVKDLEDRCAYLLHHQKGQGLTHIVRHVAPNFVLIAPSMIRETKLEEIKGWVGTVVVMGDGHQTGNVRYVQDSENVYRNALSV